MRSTGPAAISATRSAYLMASVFGVTSASNSSSTDSSRDTSSASHSTYSCGTPQAWKRSSVRSVVALDATISATVLISRTVDRKRLGSRCNRCRIRAARLPSSAR